MRDYTIFCSTNISQESSRRRSAIGASRYQRQVSKALPSQPFRRHSLTSIVIAPLDYPQISCKPSAISSARTRTNESISPAYSTRNGSNRIRSQSKNQPNRKHRSRITRGNSNRSPCGRRSHFAKRSGYKSSEIVRLTADELFVREGSDLARFDQNHVVRILHFAFNEQKGFLCNHEPRVFE
jgi:hypothetical protein